MTTKRREPLTRDRVLDTAIRLGDEGGIESISMRKLGRALGVEAMSLYNHVANKDDLLDGMVDRNTSNGDLGPRNSRAPPLGVQPHHVPLPPRAGSIHRLDPRTTT